MRCPRVWYYDARGDGAAFSLTFSWFFDEPGSDPLTGESFDSGLRCWRFFDLT